MRNGFAGEQSVILPQAVVEAERGDPLVSSLYITDIGYFPHAAGHACRRREPIAEHVLIYCVEGAGWYQVGDERHDVARDHYFILPPGRPHAYGADAAQPWTIYWIHFTGAHAAIYSQGCAAPQPIAPAADSRIVERNAVFEEILGTLRRSFDRESLRYASSLLHYYLATMRYLRLYRRPAAEQAEPSLSPAVIHYLREHIETRVTLGQIARYMGYSPTYLSAAFRRETGHSPLQYLNRMRIEMACQWLAGSRLKVNQICHKVGIGDPYYFSRLFRGVMGCSPLAYRRRTAEEEGGLVP